MEVAEDNEPSLSKVDVVLTFTLEVSFTLVYQSLAKNGFFGYSWISAYSQLGRKVGGRYILVIIINLSGKIFFSCTADYWWLVKIP